MSRRADELIDEQLASVGPERLITKMDTVYLTLLREFNRPRNPGIWAEILIRIAAKAGVLSTVPPTAQAVAAAREKPPKPRWEMLSAMVYGDTNHVLKVRELYELGSGKPATTSYTGRGTYPNAYNRRRKRTQNRTR
jgi:hypothetical protein